MPGLLDIAQEAPATSLLQSSYLENLVNSYGIRKPYKSELEFFKKRPEVAGMATEDSKIILNPFSSNNPQEQNLVAQNEALRLFMNENKVNPNFSLTKEQKSMFKGSEYETDEQSAKQSIIARFLTGDPSVGNVTKEQKDYADALKMKIK
jgi:hypothetical protein